MGFNNDIFNNKENYFNDSLDNFRDKLLNLKRSYYLLNNNNNNNNINNNINNGLNSFNGQDSMNYTIIYITAVMVFAVLLYCVISFFSYKAYKIFKNPFGDIFESEENVVVSENKLSKEPNL